MNEVYRYTGYSKQAFHQKMDRQLSEQEQSLLLVPIVLELRAEHPGVAARQLYRILRPEHLGRDRFEQLCFEQGLRLERPGALHRTTDSRGVVRFANLVTGREFRAVNQAWVSDITYFQIGEVFFYLTFIVDLYSRRIVGYSVAKRLLTGQTTLPALQMALAQRTPPPGLIFHSDGGGQYYCKAFLALTGEHKIHNSMCDVVYENAHAERVNGTIKNQYLKGYNPKDYASLVIMTRRAVRNYNEVRPHKSLYQLTPDAFEKQGPAGGSLLENDDFCTCSNPTRQQQKNHHLPTRANFNQEIKPIEKTVNVF